MPCGSATYPCGSTTYIATNHIETASLSRLDPLLMWRL
jgi:hypothetical protein